MNRYRQSTRSLYPIKEVIIEEQRPSSNIIKRREIDPLLLKAYEVVTAYRQAADCMVSVLDQNGRFIEIADHTDTVFFCALCKRHCPDPTRVWGKNEYPCTQMHIDSMNKAHRTGGTYIYMCELGFVYCVSLIYSGGRQVGGIHAGRVLGVTQQEGIKRICAMSRGAVSEFEATVYLADIPERTYEEIKALAQMLGFCAEQLSASADNYNENIKPIPEQETRSARPDRLQKHKNAPAPTYPLDKERLLLAALRRGDTETGRKILHELLDSIITTNPGNFEFIQFRAIELVVILSREALNSNIASDTAEHRVTLEVNNRYIRKIQESRNIKELLENLYAIMDRIGRKIFSFQGVRHASALRKAERYIWEHYTRKLSLQEIAEVSGLSASYFSSIFKEEMGENLSGYLNRLRAEKAAVMLTETELSLHQIARACGFEDQSWFSKIFKSYAGVSPGKYREQGYGVLTGIGEKEASLIDV